MKYAIIGDIHGRDLGDLEKALKFEKPDSLICLGDFDQVKSIRQFMDLEKRFLERGKEVIKVPGNHDYALLNNFGISSRTLNQQGGSILEFHQELIEDIVAHKYFFEFVNSGNKKEIFLDENIFSKDYKTIIIHGAVGGDLSSFPRCPEKIKDLWFRLRTKEDYKKNFKIMGEEGYNVMIRGHDHDAVYVYEDSTGKLVPNLPWETGPRYELDLDKKHVINPGALFDGSFAMIDTNVSGKKVPILEYFQL